MASVDPSFTELSVNTAVTDIGRTVDSGCVGCESTRCGTSASTNTLPNAASVFIHNNVVNDRSIVGTLNCAVDWCRQSSCSFLCYTQHLQIVHPDYNTASCVVCHTEYGFDDVEDPLQLVYHLKVGCCSDACKIRRVWQFDELHPADYHFGRIKAKIEIVKYAIATARIGEVSMWPTYVEELSKMMTSTDVSQEITFERSCELYSRFRCSFPEFANHVSLLLPHSPNYDLSCNNIDMVQEAVYANASTTIINASMYAGIVISKVARFRRIYTASTSLQSILNSLRIISVVLQRALDHSLISPKRLAVELSAIMVRDKRNEEYNVQINAKIAEIRSRTGPMHSVMCAFYVRQTTSLLSAIECAWRNPQYNEAMLTGEPMWTIIDPKWRLLSVSCEQCDRHFMTTEAEANDDWNHEVNVYTALPRIATASMTICRQAGDVSRCLARLCYDVRCHIMHTQQRHSEE